jgi:hypothetical protein
MSKVKRKLPSKLQINLSGFGSTSVFGSVVVGAFQITFYQVSYKLISLVLVQQVCLAVWLWVLFK